ncbi:hypothetical protein CHUAL_010534 [Chamberlinius hualienensis]
MLFWIKIVLSLFYFGVEASSRPNIVIILADDLGWNDVSFHGSNEIPTPNIDALAYRGVILNNYYVLPICSPSRSALLTGKHPIHTGMQGDVIFGMQPYGLPLTEKLLPHYLKELGYATHLVGKWHQGFFRTEYTPTYRGFDSHFGYFCGHQDYYSHQALESSDNVGFDMRRNMSVAWDTVNKYSTNLFTDEAISVINNHDTSQPLFLFLSELAVHAGNSYDTIQAPAEYIARFPYIEDLKRRKFAGVLTLLDESVGNVTIALNDRGMLNNTIILFSTDNGGATGGYDGNAGSNFPLKGCKDTLFEGGVRGSGFIWSPFISNSSRVSNEMMSIQDWLPTLISAAGGNGSISGIDGINMWDSISRGTPSPITEILHNIDDVRIASAIRSGDYKLVSGTTHGGHYDGWFGPPKYYINIPHSYSNIKNTRLNFELNEFQHLDYIHYKNVMSESVIDCGSSEIPPNATIHCISSPCLYNIRDDPCEYYNIADEQPEVVTQLMDRLDWYRSTAVPQLNKPNDPEANPKYHGYVWVPWKDNEN